MSDEHLWSKWMQSLYPDAKTNFHAVHQVDETTNGSSLGIKRGEFSRGGGTISQTIRAVCETCNNEWMSQIDQRAKQPFFDLFKNGKSKISCVDAEALFDWLHLKSCFHIESFGGDSLVGKALREYEALKTSYFHNYHRTRMVPYEFRLFLARAENDNPVFSFNHLPLGWRFNQNVRGEVYDVFPRASIAFYAGNMIAFLTSHSAAAEAAVSHFCNFDKPHGIFEVKNSNRDFFLSTETAITRNYFQLWFNITHEELVFREHGKRMKLREFVVPSLWPPRVNY